MKNSAIRTVFVVLSILLGASSAWAAVSQESDGINKSFTLPGRARVDVSAINGSVDIQATDGDTANVQLERTGRSRTEMDCNKVTVEQVLGTLTIESENVGGPGCQTIQVKHRLLLTLPRHANLSVHGVAGPINVGEIDGTLRLSGNSGNINLAQPGRGSRITGHSGTISIKLHKLEPPGLELSGNIGAIKLYVDEESNAAVRVSGLSGTASSELPNVRFIKTGDADYYARIGSGRPMIYVEGNSGNISLIHYRE